MRAAAHLRAGRVERPALQRPPGKDFRDSVPVSTNGNYTGNWIANTVTQICTLLAWEDLNITVRMLINFCLAIEQLNITGDSAVDTQSNMYKM